MSTRLSARAEVPLDVEAALRRVEAAIVEATACDEPLLARMVGDLVRAGGKRMRPRIALLAFDACGGAPSDVERVVEAGAAFELIHTASLVHDDIIDQSPLRRGRPTLHVAYGLGHALVAGDFLFTRGFALSGRLPKDVIAVTAEACVRLAEGEVMEQRLLAEEVDEERYLRIIAKKTAEPIRACAMTGAMLAGAPPHVAEALGHYGLEIGIAFQIADDVLDIAGDPAETGKAVGQDAKTGVLTFPVGLGQDARAFRELARHTDPEELRRLLQEAGAIEKARAVALRYVERAKGRLDVLAPGPAKDALTALAQSVVDRRK
ncbi:MAG TPA: polyprenyl synthetase family protein [Candidatus Thermoplasmatota archaeon]|nr:polyprenyl synthetase family protein [Candidatus Thermoplasmatota archaeon]